MNDRPRNKSKQNQPVPNQLSLAGEQRLNKLLAAAGLGSRRQVDELIEQGRVEVDGKVVGQLGAKVNMETSKVSVDGVALKKFRPVYFALNKPAGVLCTNRDPEGRPRAVDLIPGHHRLFPVGRLDAASVGLLLMTNDGELTQRLTHPKHGVPKTYFVVVAGHLEPQQLKRLERGIYLAEGVARVQGAKIRRVRKGCTELDITLCEGKNREIRRLLARLGNKVITLKRTAIGPLKLAEMPESAYRPLTTSEVKALYQAADEAAKARKKQREERASKDSTTAKDSERSQRPKKQKPLATEGSSSSSSSKVSRRSSITSDQPTRDPFAWDNDDELLAASPFAGDVGAAFHRSDDDELADVSSPQSDTGFDADEFDSGSVDELMEDGGVLFEDGPGARSGSVIDYNDSSDRPVRPNRKRAAKGFASKERLGRKSKRASSKMSFGERRERFAGPKKSWPSTGRPAKKKGFGKKKGPALGKAAKSVKPSRGPSRKPSKFGTSSGKAKRGQFRSPKRRGK
jgi:23S rRNA pseudouridine2605 synthase